MSFLGHPVCHLGLNWCILLGLFIVFPALAKCSCCLLFPLGNQNMGKAHSNANIPLRTKSSITNVAKNGITGNVWDFWGH